jgi:hypothetical protein
VAAICVHWKWSWRPALIAGITESLALNLAEGARIGVTPVVGAQGVIEVSASTAVVAAALLGMVLTRLLKARG